MSKDFKTRLFQFIAICIFSWPICAQDVLWEKSYGGKHAEILFDAVPTADYGFILAGSSLSDKSGNKTSINKGDLDYWIWKMDEKGDPEWQKSFGGSGADFLQSIKLTKDGGFILAGNSNSPKGDLKKDDCRGGEDFWIIKLDAGGGEQWQKTLGGTGQEKLQSIFQTNDGGYILGGSSSSEKSADKTTGNFGNMDYWIVKLDDEGKIEWQKTLGGVYFDELRSIEQTKENGYIIGGYSNSPSSNPLSNDGMHAINKTKDNVGIGDYWIVKLDKKGNEEWQQVIGGDKDDQLTVVHQTYDEGFILGGNSNSGSSNNKSKGNGKGTDFWVVKINAAGEMVWQETYDFGKTDILTSIVENKDHTLLVGGFAKGEVNQSTESKAQKEKKGINDYIALKISETGDELWNKTVGSDGDDALQKLIETRDGGYLLAGTSNPIATSHSRLEKSSKSGKSSPVSLGSGQPNKQLQNTTKAANEQVKEVTDGINDSYNEAIGSMTDEINKATDLGKDSPLKFEVDKPKGSPIGNDSPLSTGGNGANPVDGLMSGMNKKQATLPASGDKKTNYGNKDFWVVKLLDRSKPQKPKAAIEAFPNPTGDFTNVIVGYEYESGTATLVDLAGHILKQFEITGRTVPVDLSLYPEGIYVVNVKTNVQSDGVKIIKNK